MMLLSAFAATSAQAMLRGRASFGSSRVTPVAAEAVVAAGIGASRGGMELQEKPSGSRLGGMATAHGGSSHATVDFYPAISLPGGENLNTIRVGEQCLGTGHVASEKTFPDLQAACTFLPRHIDRSFLAWSTSNDHDDDSLDSDDSDVDDASSRNSPTITMTKRGVSVGATYDDAYKFMGKWVYEIYSSEEGVGTFIFHPSDWDKIKTHFEGTAMYHLVPEMLRMHTRNSFQTAIETLDTLCNDIADNRARDFSIELGLLEAGPKFRVAHRSGPFRGLRFQPIDSPNVDGPLLTKMTALGIATKSASKL